LTIEEPRSPRRWWVLAVAGLRAVVTASVLVALYYLLPLHGRAEASTVAGLAIGILVFIGLMVWYIRAILQSDHPGLRALEGLFIAVPVFILLFATAYYLMSRGDPASFTAPLTRTDALYFTVTIFATVGFGDISARAQSARLVVTAQMVLDLVILGLGARIILGAVQRGRRNLPSETGADSAVQ
jgi:voltage-gated potassium channel